MQGTNTAFVRNVKPQRVRSESFEVKLGRDAARRDLERQRANDRLRKGQ